MDNLKYRMLSKVELINSNMKNAKNFEFLWKFIFLRNKTSVKINKFRCFIYFFLLIVFVISLYNFSKVKSHF